MSWKLAPSLAKLRSEFNTRHPNRSKASDGTIGDANHQKRVSEHNPDDQGVVRAIDLTASGALAQELLDVTIGDPRVHYVIHNRTIYSRTYGWKARDYKGYNAHLGHVHISILNNTSGRATVAERKRAAEDTSAWFKSSTPAPKPTPPASSSTLREDAPPRKKRDAVAKLQAGLNRVFPKYSRLTVDGYFGPATTTVVREFQRRHGKGLIVDGIVGPATRAALATYGITI